MMIISLAVESNDGVSFATAIVDGTKPNRCKSSFAKSVSENSPTSSDCIFCFGRVSTSSCEYVLKLSSFARSAGSCIIIFFVCSSISVGSTTSSAADSSNATISPFAISVTPLPDVTNTSAFISGICSVPSIIANNIAIIFFFTTIPLFHFHIIL